MHHRIICKTKCVNHANNCGKQACMMMSSIRIASWFIYLIVFSMLFLIKDENRGIFILATLFSLIPGRSSDSSVTNQTPAEIFIISKRSWNRVQKRMVKMNSHQFVLSFNISWRMLSTKLVGIRLLTAPSDSLQHIALKKCCNMILTIWNHYLFIGIKMIAYAKYFIIQCNTFMLQLTTLKQLDAEQNVCRQARNLCSLSWSYLNASKQMHHLVKFMLSDPVVLKLFRH